MHWSQTLSTSVVGYNILNTHINRVVISILWESVYLWVWAKDYVFTSMQTVQKAVTAIN